MTSRGENADPQADLQADLQAKARDHLWPHFGSLAALRAKGLPVITRGEGCHVWDDQGRRYLDALAGLFVVQAGHGRDEIVERGAEQGRQLGYFPIWSYGHPPAIELAARLAEHAPGDLNRVFFTTGGSEAVETAWKLARHYFKVIGQPQRYKVISRTRSYHGTTLGALSITGVTALRSPYEPITPGAYHVATTNSYRSAFPDEITADPEAFAKACADSIEQAIEAEGPETVAAVFLEPVQNSGGSFTPPPGYFARVREICDRYGVLLVSDEVICAYGRLGHMFGCERYGYVPDMITSAKGLTSGYAPLGAVLVSDRIAEPFTEPGVVFTHGLTFAGHPVSCAVALANLDVFEREDLLGNVLAHEDDLRGRMESLLDLPIVGDVRGAGYFLSLELVKDKANKSIKFTQQESSALIRGHLGPKLYEAGIICRADDRGEPVIQLAPPLVMGPEGFAEIEKILRPVLAEAWTHING
ncbi:aspartate aminotransferase family protein [Streptosporangium sp. NPDC051022]|uniref:aspartate aminotransferase family protein n=1 Tax=Streptosporangium sp. NPDC051022 TaxID=3155752 RepID=UPI00343D366D